MNFFKKALIAILSVGLVTVPSAKEVEKVEAADLVANDVLYLKPNSNWTKDNARFAAYFFGNGDAWASMTKTGSYYYVNVPSGKWTNVIFCRMNPSASANNWNNKWNQTGDLTWESGKNLFTIPNGAWNGSTTSWSDYSEFKLTLDYNCSDITTTQTEKLYRKCSGLNNPIQLDKYAKKREGYNLLGWSLDKSNTTAEYSSQYTYNGATKDVTIYAIWTPATTYNVTFDFNGVKYDVSIEENKTIESAISQIETIIKDNNYKVLDWGIDLSEQVTKDMTITPKYYENLLDEKAVKGQLGFNYSYEEYYENRIVKTLVAFQINGVYDTKVTCVAKDSKSNEETQYVMHWTADITEFNKKEYVVNVPTNYDTLKFVATNINGKEVTTKEFNRTFEGYQITAIWYDSEESNGFYNFTATKLNANATDNGVIFEQTGQIDELILKYKINSVSNMKMKFSLSEYPSYSWVSHYGVDLVRSDSKKAEVLYTAEEVSKKTNENSTFVSWSAIINNIPETAFNLDIKATFFIMIDNQKINLSSRTLSVIEMADEYSNTLTGLEKEACGYIVSTNSN